MRLVIMKKGGEAGEVAINPELITHIRSMPGPYTDIYFKDFRVAVEGSFRQVLDALSERRDQPAKRETDRSWLTRS